jgi:hypothetical protein
MKLLANQKGIALVTALLLTLISLTIVMYLFYMITAGVKLSGANKRYKTALEASYGATDLIIKEIIPAIFSKTIAEGSSTPYATSLAGLYASSMDFYPSSSSSDACLMEKITKPSSKWSAACSKTTNPKDSPDFSIKLNSTSSDPFTVYTKIIDTICSDKRAYPTGKCTGSDLSGYDQLDGGQGTTGGASGITVQAMPATYRIEVQGERTTNSSERSKLSILYAY